MITASHNPPEYNGVKIIEADGTEMGDEETLKLEQLIFEPSFSPQSWEYIGHEINAPYLTRKYIQAIVHHFPDRTGSGITVVVDPGIRSCMSYNTTDPDGNGMQGAHAQWYNGRYISPEGYLSLLLRVSKGWLNWWSAVEQHSGLRTMAMRIVLKLDENGRFVEENLEFALVAQHICHQKKGTVVTPVSTSLAVEMVVKNEGCTISSCTRLEVSMLHELCGRPHRGWK